MAKAGCNKNVNPHTAQRVVKHFLETVSSSYKPHPGCPSKLNDYDKHQIVNDVSGGHTTPPCSLHALRRSYRRASRSAAALAAAVLHILLSGGHIMPPPPASWQRAVTSPGCTRDVANALVLATLSCWWLVVMWWRLRQSHPVVPLSRRACSRLR